MCKYFLYSCNYLWVTECHVCIFLKERIFFLHVYPQLSFFLKLGLCLSLSPPLLFPPKTVFSKTYFVFPIFIGGEIFLTFVVLRGSCCSSQGELLLFIGGVVSIFYRVELFCLPLILYFLLSFIAYVYSLLSCLCQYMTKRGDLDEMWESCLFCLGGDTLIIYDSGKYKYVLLYLTQRESQFAYLLFSCLLVLFPHMRLCILFIFQEIYRLIQLSCCLHLQLMDSSQD